MCRTVSDGIQGKSRCNNLCIKWTAAMLVNTVNGQKSLYQKNRWEFLNGQLFDFLLIEVIECLVVLAFVEFYENWLTFFLSNIKNCH